MSISHILSVIVFIFTGGWLVKVKSELAKLKTEARSVVTAIETKAKVEIEKLKGML